MNYNWQQKDWPEFTYELRNLEDALYSFIYEVNKLRRVFSALPWES